MANPIRCQVIVDLPDGGKSTVITQLSDISGGGMALTFPPNSVNVTPDMEFSSCRLELPEVGVIVGNLKVRNVFEITLRSGIRVLRAGCQFVRLPGPMLTLVQRYIIKVERERKARESGLV
jgi:c-di-GMP-binding flagellar brake protein YcgR